MDNNAASWRCSGGWLLVEKEEAHGRVSRVGVELRRHGKSLHPNISLGNYIEPQNRLN